MGVCYITRRGTKTGGATEQLGIYPVGNDGRPAGNVIVPNDVLVLSDYIFKNNSNILTVALGADLYKMSSYSFQNCISLQEIKIPNEVNTIPEYCFNGCTAMSKAVLPKKLTEIHSYSFQNCSNLRTVTIPDEITSLVIKGYAFTGCSSLTNETVSKLAQLTQGSIYTYAFCGLTGITEVTTAYTNNYYFSDCTNLKKVTILNPLSGGGFGEKVFDNCTNLTTVILPDNATIINSSMFEGRSKLSSVNIPSSLITINSYAFSNTAINNIVLPDTLTTIGSYAFSGCTKLTSINIPEKVTVIYSDAFYGCSNLTSVTVAENANYTLGQYAFQSTGITDVCVADIIAHASSVESHIFDKCNSLENVEVKYFWSNMFSNCIKLKTAKCTETGNNKSIGNSVFYRDTALEEVFIAEGYTTIGTAVFYGCNSLKKVYLPSSITTATSSSLTSTSSSYYTFYNCTALEDVQLGVEWNMSLRLDVSPNITVESMIAMFNSLKDLTGNTAKTLTLGSTNLAKLTDEQKAIATNKNWTLA